MESDHQGCLDAGMDDYLAKPLTLKALAATLARWAPGGSIPAALEDLDEYQPTLCSTRRSSIDWCNSEPSPARISWRN